MSLRNLWVWRFWRDFPKPHRASVFERSMRRFLAGPESCADPTSPVLADLMYGWGNSFWAAGAEYLAAGVRNALVTPGPILECGSGLTTLLVGGVATRRGLGYWALENSDAWAEGTRSRAAAHRLDVKVHSKGIKRYAEFDWYDPPLEAMPRDFHLVLCDGPAGKTRGGRYGLVPVMRDHLAPGCVVLLDDTRRARELEIAHRWQQELGATLELQGSGKRFGRITLPA